jgi:hypothetical protein
MKSSDTTIAGPQPQRSMLPASCADAGDKLHASDARPG